MSKYFLVEYLHKSLVDPEIAAALELRHHKTFIGEYTGVITNKRFNTDYAWNYYSEPLDVNDQNRWRTLYISNTGPLPDQEFTIFYGKNYWKERKKD